MDGISMIKQHAQQIYCQTNKQTKKTTSEYACQHILNEQENVKIETVRIASVQLTNYFFFVCQCLHNILYWFEIEILYTVR